MEWVRPVGNARSAGACGTRENRCLIYREHLLLHSSQLLLRRNLRPKSFKGKCKYTILYKNLLILYVDKKIHIFETLFETDESFCGQIGSDLPFLTFFRSNLFVPSGLCGPQPHLCFSLHLCARHQHVWGTWPWYPGSLASVRQQVTWVYNPREILAFQPQTSHPIGNNTQRVTFLLQSPLWTLKPRKGMLTWPNITNQPLYFLDRETKPDILY